jgi:hypothetical protein
MTEIFQVFGGIKKREIHRTIPHPFSKICPFLLKAPPPLLNHFDHQQDHYVVTQ